MNKEINNILVCGSIVYDRIMNFPGKFSDHILPDKVHILNVSFTLNKVKESFGGTGANIAYNLALLGEQPKLLGAVGGDFSKYAEWLKKNKIDITNVKVVKDEMTASAYIMTDQADNQIAGFYPGSTQAKSCQFAKKIKNVKIAIISPDAKARMMSYAKIFRQSKVPYIFDPGQQIISLNKQELKQAINGAKVLIGNDYEVELMQKMLKKKLVELESLVEILVITKGEKGSEIYCQGKKIIIPSAKPKNTSDPTGAGDAYRAGFIKGLVSGWSLAKAGRLAGLVAVYTVEKYGTQTHRFNWLELEKRYRENYGESL